MAVFEAVEMDVVIKLKVVTYYPTKVIEHQTFLQSQMNEALASAGKDFDFLPSPASVTISQGPQP